MKLMTQCTNKLCNGRIFILSCDDGRYEKFLKRTVRMFTPIGPHDVIYYICLDNKTFSFISNTFGIHCPYCGSVWDYQESGGEKNNLSMLLLEEYIFEKEFEEGSELVNLYKEGVNKNG